jgi:hypothetical protein
MRACKVELADGDLESRLQDTPIPCLSFIRTHAYIF